MSKPCRKRNSYAILCIVGSYVAFAGSWMYLLGWFLHGTGIMVHLFDALLFISVTSVFLYLLICRYITESKRSETLLRARLRLSDLACNGTLNDLMSAALDTAELLTDSRIGYFHFVEADQENISLQAWSSNTIGAMCRAEGKGKHYPISQAGVWVDCFYARAPVVHNDYAALSHKKGLPEGHAQIVRELGVPVMHGDKVVAILGVGNKPADYTRSDVNVVHELASIAIDLVARKQAEAALREANDQLEDRVRERTVELEQVNCSLKEEIAERKRAEEELLLHRDHLDRLVKDRTAELASRNEQLAVEVIERRLAENSQESIIELLRLCNKAESTLELIRSLTLFFQRLTGCEAVGVRLREGEDYPYYETRGFTEHFVMAEKNLCSLDPMGKVICDSMGKPVLDCLCGRIIRGRFDPSPSSYTPNGSFWTNSFSDTLSCMMDADREGNWRRVCIKEGYESMALVLIRSQNETFGLFQFTDRCKERFTVEKIALLENLVSYVAIALAKLKSDEALARSERAVREAQNIAHLGSYEYDISADRWTSSEIMNNIFGIGEELYRNKAGWGKIIHPLDRKEMLAYLEEIIEQNRRFDREYRIIRLDDGAERWVHALGRVEYGTDGAPVSMVGTIQDVTERKKTEEALQKNEERLKLALATSKEAEETLRNYARRLIEMEEGMRKQLAAELHDEIGRDLTALNINLAIINSSLSLASREKFGARVEDSVKLLEDIGRTIRNIMSKLRPPVLDDYGLAAALRWYADLFSKRTGISVSLQMDDAFPRLVPGKETALFRIAQEALTNAAKHSGAQLVTITLQCGDDLIRLSVIDDGKGFAPDAALSLQPGFGWGLTIMRERAELIGGAFHLDSASGETTMVTVEIREGA